MSKFKLEDHCCTEFEADAIRQEATLRVRALGVPKPPFSIPRRKLDRIIANLCAHRNSLAGEVNVLRREYERVSGSFAWPSSDDARDEAVIRGHMKRRYLTSCETVSVLFRTVHELRAIAAALDADSCAEYSVRK